MFDLHQHLPIDKASLIGGCKRLRVEVDAKQLRTEVDALPSSLWGTTGGRVGVHSAADAIFLRGFAPAEGPKPIEDREPLAQLPYVQRLIRKIIPAEPQRCLLAKLPGGAKVAPHIDRAPYFSKTVRIHVPVETQDQVWMIGGERIYAMKEGEVWALNNSGTHAVWNAHPTAARTHLICDFFPSEGLIDLLVNGEANLGRPIPQADKVPGS